VSTNPRSFVPALIHLISYAGLDVEREATRFVILLSVCQSVRSLLSLLEEDPDELSSNPLDRNDSPFRPTSPGGREPRSQEEAVSRRRLRLAPFLGLEGPLREALGVIATGPSAASFTAHANDSGSNDKIGWRDPATTTGDVTPESRGRQARFRAASPNGRDREPMFAPHRLAKKMEALAVLGSGKELRRAKAQGNGRPTASDSNWTEGGTFLAGKDDPIHIVAALKTEIQGVWAEAVARGLIAGEGPMQGKEGGYDLAESSR
jgi:hypothetical protein